MFCVNKYKNKIFLSKYKKLIDRKKKKLKNKNIFTSKFYYFI